MNIVIVGAGVLGSYVAKVLSQEGHNIIIVDKDPHRLSEIFHTIDVAIHEGSGSDWRVLEELTDLEPDLFISLTDSDETNLAACTIAKNLGYKQTVASIRATEYLDTSRLDFNSLFYADHLICPDLIVAQEIFRNIGAIDFGSSTVGTFANGAVQIQSLVIPNEWEGRGKDMMHLALPEGVMVGLIRRQREDGEHEIIFPHGKDRLLPGDEVTFVGETEQVVTLPLFFGIAEKTVKTVVIIGGSLTALLLAEILVRHDINVRFIDKSYQRCEFLSRRMPNATITHHDGSDTTFLLAERIDTSDVIITCTRHDEVNILGALTAREIGCNNIIATVGNMSYIPILEKLGARHTVSPRVCAANAIRMLTNPNVSVRSMLTLYEDRAQIIEVKTAYDSKIAGLPLSDLGPKLPKDFLICAIQNRGRIFIAKGDRIICPEDTVVVISAPKHFQEIGKIF
ncbi:Trk system potassium transporter TrkA [Simkania negevensis]|uniref:Trk system potassium uptake protein TrkA n=1 Tax=Simkania negevensis TaxID=83561 RepID=A0ABS3AS13_9BACT|nr:Trk system potassium transporter TrkA [Simkania negevensis]